MLRTFSRIPALPRRLALICALAALGFAFPHTAHSQPESIIKLVVGFGAGGPTDIAARALADRLSAQLGRTVVVENKPGASGNIATQAVAAADANGGLTLLIGALPLAVNHTLFPDFPVKFGRDLVAVAGIGATDNVLVVRPSLDVRDLKGFVALLRAKPGAITYAALGKGSSSDLSGAAFDAAAGTKMIAVNYRGGGEAAKDLLGGHVDAWFATIPSVLDSIQSGQLKALATTGPGRVHWLADVPTLAESGFPKFDVRLWIGLFAPAGAPPDTLANLERAVARVMATADMQAVLDAQGISPLPMNRTDFSAYVQQEIERWRGILGTARAEPKN